MSPLPPKDTAVQIDLRAVPGGYEIVFVGFWDSGCVYDKETALKIADGFSDGFEKGGWTVERLYRWPSCAVF